MKKTIFLVLAAAALLLLSGCDAMLEAFYPEYAKNYDNYNVLTVEYDLNSLTAQQIINLDLNNKPIKVELYLSGQTPTANVPVDFIEVYGEASYWYDFYVSDGSYDIWIWQDTNGSGKLDTGEFVLKDDTTVIPKFFFSGTSGQYEYYYGDQWTTF